MMSLLRSPSRLTSAVAAVSGLGLAAGLAAGCTSGAGQAPAAGSGLAALSPRQILSRADAAATAAGSLHFHSTTQDGQSSIVFNDDSASGSGRQDITISGGGQMTVLVVAGVGYVNGNADALQGFLGLPAATAAQLAGQWISFSSGDPGYQQVVAGVTTSSVLAEITPVGSLTKIGPTTVDGQSVVGVRGAASSSAGMPAGTKITLYVAADGRALPVSCLEGSGSGQTDITLSQWGEHVSVAAPAHAVPLPSAPSAPSAPGIA
jgi:hypothetical protein